MRQIWPIVVEMGFENMIFPLNPDNVDFSNCIKNMFEKLQGSKNIFDTTTNDFQVSEKIISQWKSYLERYNSENSGIILDDPAVNVGAIVSMDNVHKW